MKIENVTSMTVEIENGAMTVTIERPVPAEEPVKFIKPKVPQTYHVLLAKRKNFAPGELANIKTEYWALDFWPATDDQRCWRFEFDSRTLAQAMVDALKEYPQFKAKLIDHALPRASSTAPTPLDDIVGWVPSVQKLFDLDPKDAQCVQWSPRGSVKSDLEK